jgi:hypothetical protein
MDPVDISPSLTENGVKYYLNQTLLKCSYFKHKYYNVVFNVVLGVMLLLLFIVILVIKYKGKLTPEEIEEKSKEKRLYILSKIKKYQENKLRAQQHLITGLPQWN